MTKLSIDGQPLVPDPRPGQWDEANQATDHANLARTSGDLDSYHWWIGVSSGYMSAFNPHALWRDDLRKAKQSLVARTLGLDEATDRAGRFGLEGLQRRRFLMDCGVLWGFKEATAERDDAQECIACNARILSDVDEQAYQTHHGWVCNDDCHITYGGSNCCAAERREGLL